MSGAQYMSALQGTLEGVVASLTCDGIQPQFLSFGGGGEPPARKPTVPTDARSEFLANRAMGDWAEQRLADALNRAFTDWKVVQYGSTDRIAAGHPEFKARYLAGLEETRLYGKRPDLLLYPASTPIESDLSERSHAETEPMAKQAVAAIEVRSSKFEALTYMAVRQRQRAEGKKGVRETPSFTVKVEDLLIVYRWLEWHAVPQTYCQVFFDSLFAINFLDIFRFIAGGEVYAIEKPKKSQEKATIMLPITCGVQVGRATALPTFRAEHRVTQLGRHDAYVVPEGGALEMDAAAMCRVLLAE